MKPIIALILWEFIYKLAQLFILAHSDSHVNAELAITLQRLIFSTIYIAVFYKTLQGNWNNNIKAKPLFVLSVIMVLLLPFLNGNCNIGDHRARFIFAITSIAVGIREEITYRGLFQKFLSIRFGMIVGIIVSSFFFMLMHLGYQPFSIQYFSLLFAYGIVFSLIYLITNSLFFCIVLHTIIDATYAYSPFITNPFGNYTSMLITMLTIFILGYHYKRMNVKQ